MLDLLEHLWDEKKKGKVVEEKLKGEEPLKSLLFSDALLLIG